MRTNNALRLFGAAMILGASAAAAAAQTAPSTPATPPADKPAVTQPSAPAPAQPSATAPSDAKALIGLNALSSDGNKVGEVRAVKTAPDGQVAAIQLKVGGFFGFGGRIVEVPEDKFTSKGIVVQIDYTLDDVDKLPEAQDGS